MASSASPAKEGPSSASGNCLLRSMLLCYLVALAAFAGWAASSHLWRDFSILQLEETYVLRRFAFRIAAAMSLDLLLFLPLAFLVSANVSAAKGAQGCLHAALTFAMAILISCLLTLVARTALAGFPLRRPAFPESCLLLGIVLAGSWGGMTWRQSKTCTGWIFSQSLLCVVSLVCLA